MHEEEIKSARKTMAVLLWIIALVIWIFWSGWPAPIVVALSVGVFFIPDEAFVGEPKKKGAAPPPLHFRGTKKPSSGSAAYEDDDELLDDLESDFSGGVTEGSIECFVYQDAEGNISYKEILVEERTDDYLEGHYLDTGARRTFRLDRILETMTELDDPDERVLHYQANADPVKERVERLRRYKGRRGLVICFTGFKSTLRSELEANAFDAGFHVVKSVTQDLSFLVVGDTAGPAKLSKAEGMGVQILDEQEFALMASTGEVPL